MDSSQSASSNQSTVPNRFVHLDRDQVRILAHPFRIRILTVLRQDGPSTATRLAAILDTDTGKTSYHLRTLAEVGLIVDAAERGNQRDRWWEAAHKMTVFAPEDFRGDPDSEAAAQWLLGAGARYYATQIEHWLASHSDWSAEWQDAAEISDFRLHLKPAQLRELNDEVLAVVARYLEKQSSADGIDAVDCTVIFNGFPNPNPSL